MMIHVKPLWDVIDGNFKVDTATAKGLGEISGDNRVAFEEALRKTLPAGENIVVEYGDKPKLVPAACASVPGARPA